MWLLSLGPSQDLAPFPADPKRQTLAMGPHQTGKRPWESVFLFFLKIDRQQRHTTPRGAGAARLNPSGYGCTSAGHTVGVLTSHCVTLVGLSIRPPDRTAEVSATVSDGRGRPPAR